MYCRHSCGKEVDRIYHELISIKPGFHEIWVHEKYFDRSNYPKGRNEREKVFLALRGCGDIKLTKYPADINSKAYFTYASCAVTEGPFVFRKGATVSYFSEIKKIKSGKQKRQLKENFHILDYHQGITSIRTLRQLLNRAEKYRRFMK